MNIKRYHVSRNLFDKDKQPGNIYVTDTAIRYGVEVPVEAGIYTIVGGTNKLFVKEKYGTTYGAAIDTSVRRNITLPQNGYILIYSAHVEDYIVSNIMLNTGSIPLPYEPYSSEAWHDSHYIRVNGEWQAVASAHERTSGAWT